MLVISLIELLQKQYSIGTDPERNDPKTLRNLNPSSITSGKQL